MYVQLAGVAAQIQPVRVASGGGGGHVENPQQTGGWRPVVVAIRVAREVVITNVGGDLISSADA
jgi:hypothetical protein